MRLTRFRLFAILLACCAVLALASCAPSAGQQSAATPAVTPTAAATATPSAPPKVIFRSDWSHGAGVWKLPPHWMIRNGALVTDGQEQEKLPIPYTVTAPSYRFAITWQMVDVTYKQVSCNNYFGILSLDSGDARQYEALSTCFGPYPFHGDSRLVGADGDGHVWELTIHGTPRTSRVDVHGNFAAYFPTNTGSVGSVQNESGNTPAHLFLEASQVKVIITGIVIWSL